jgi:hypothetical protein
LNAKKYGAKNLLACDGQKLFLCIQTGSENLPVKSCVSKPSALTLSIGVPPFDNGRENLPLRSGAAKLKR